MHVDDDNADLGITHKLRNGEMRPLAGKALLGIPQMRRFSRSLRHLRKSTYQLPAVRYETEATLQSLQKEKEQNAGLT